MPLVDSVVPGAPPTVILDGANLAWGYGLALARRFGCKVHPSAAGVLLALDYEARILHVLCMLFCVSAALTRALSIIRSRGEKRACA